MKVWLPSVRAGSGADVYVQRLGAGLRRRGVEAEVTWLPRACEFAPWLAARRPPPGTSVIHANSWYAFAFARHGLPVVATVHSPIHAPEALPHKSLGQRMYHATLIRRYESWSVGAARAVVAVSDTVARSVAAAFPGARPRVIHNWVDTGVFRPAPARAGTGGPFRLLFAGNRTRWKGWDFLDGLMRRLGGDFRLTVAAGLRGDLARDRLPPHATSLGSVGDEAGMVRAYQECDAVLVPSRLEGFGYVAAEAMACGRPVVGFRIGALEEIVPDGQAGLLVPPGDVEALAAACRRLASDGPLAAAMGEAARRAAVERFAETIALTRYLEVYSGIAG